MRIGRIGKRKYDLDKLEGKEAPKVQDVKKKETVKDAGKGKGVK